MITQFGKFLRVLRMERGELLKNMAENLNISSAYLSSIELGNREIPETMPNNIIKIYKLSEKEQIDMQKAISKSIGYVDIKLHSSSEIKKEAAVVFARNLEKMDDATIQTFINFMNTRTSK